MSFIHKKRVKKNWTENSCMEESDWIHELGGSFQIHMLSCPHCGSALGFFKVP